MIAAFMAAFGIGALGIGTVWFGTISMWRRDGREAAMGPLSIDTIKAVVPTRLKQIVVVIAGVAIISVIASFIGTGGYSQNPPWTLPHCQWSIGTNHGFTNLCVSHARWLATAEEFQRAVIGFSAVFLSAICVLLVSAAGRNYGRGNALENPV
jgi:hypothetical protein